MQRAKKWSETSFTQLEPDLEIVKIATRAAVAK